MERFKKAYTYIFNEKGWENKILAIYAVLVVATMLGAALSFLFVLPVEILSAIAEEQGRNVSGLDSLSSSISSFSSIFTLPVTLYVYGYLIEVVRNLTSSSKEILVANKEIMKKFVNGAKLYVSLFLATLPTTLIGMFLLTISIVGTIAMFSLSESNSVFMVAGIALVILTVVLGILLGVLNSIISFASMFIYFQTNSFRKSFSYSLIFQTIRNNEKNLLNIFVDFLIMGLIEFLFVIIFFIPLLCVAPFVFPMVTIVSMFAKAHIIADRFKMMSNMKD